MEKQKVTVSGEINAPVHKVWAYWNEPIHITKWNFASDDWHCPIARNDLRVGGTYAARMEAKDGSFGFDFNTTYDDVIDQKRISYTMEDGRQSTTTFEDKDGKTEIVTVFDAESQNPIEMQQAGWQAILNNFKKYVEAN